MRADNTEHIIAAAKRDPGPPQPERSQHRSPTQNRQLRWCGQFLRRRPRGWSVSVLALLPTLRLNGFRVNAVQLRNPRRMAESTAR